MIYVVAALVFISVFSFFLVLVLWPEWLGISGQDAKKTLKEQEEQKTSSPPQQS